MQVTALWRRAGEPAAAHDVAAALLSADGYARTRGVAQQAARLARARRLDRAARGRLLATRVAPRRRRGARPRAPVAGGGRALRRAGHERMARLVAHAGFADLEAALAGLPPVVREFPRPRPPDDALLAAAGRRHGHDRVATARASRRRRPCATSPAAATRAARAVRVRVSMIARLGDDPEARTLVERVAVPAAVTARRPPQVAVFGSARLRPDDAEYGEARRLGELLAGAGWTVCTGGYDGAMAAASEGAAAAGGHVVGVTVAGWARAAGGQPVGARGAGGRRPDRARGRAAGLRCLGGGRGRRGHAVRGGAGLEPPPERRRRPAAAGGGGPALARRCCPSSAATWSWRTAIWPWCGPSTTPRRPSPPCGRPSPPDRGLKPERRGCRGGEGMIDPASPPAPDRAEAQFLLLAESATEMIVRADPDGVHDLRLAGRPPDHRLRAGGAGGLRGLGPRPPRRPAGRGAPAASG